MKILTTFLHRTTRANALHTPMLLAIVAVAMIGCAAGTDKAANISILDFRAQNVERLYVGIDRLMGDDSAGAAAREYVSIYEADLVTYYPVTRKEIAPAEPRNSGWEEWNPNIASTLPEKDPFSPNFQTQRLLDYLKGRCAVAINDLRNNHDEFTRTATAANAKMGLVNAYVAVTALPSPNEIKVITDLVEPLLAALIKK